MARYGKLATFLLALVIVRASVAFDGPVLNVMQVRAASCVVTSIVDDMTTASTLRDAILQVTTGACDKAITFDPTVFATAKTITLTQTLTLSHDITITGSGAKLLTINGNDAHRVFTVNIGVTASLSGLTIAGGSSASDGGGIVNNGLLSVQNSAFSGNNTPTGKGGAIANNGTLSVVGSTFTGNRAGQSGGGIYNASGMTLTVINSTLSGNTATAQGGGIADDGGATVTAATFTGNTAVYGGGIARAPGATGGTVTRIIAAANTATGDRDYADIYNVPTNAGNVIGGAALLDAQLRDNGTLNGTQTHALLPGSPALGLIIAPCPVTYIDAVSGTITLTTDQRAVSRPVSGACDSGAFESQGFTATKTAGDNGIAAMDGTFATLLAVAVSSTTGEPVAGGQITFRITAGSGGASGTFATTGTSCTVPTSFITAVCPITSGGTVIAPALTANGFAGVFTVVVGAGGVATPATFTLAHPTIIRGITRTPIGTGLTNAGTVRWTTVFADPVTGVTAGNFTFTASSVTGAAITSVTADSGSGNRTWTVAASTGTSDGTLSLAFINGSGAAPPASNAPFGSESYTIDKTGPTITPASLPNGEMGHAYMQTLIATDAHTPTFTGMSGTLPPGLAFVLATGLMSGTPTTVGSFAFAVAAVDALGNPASRSFTIIVFALGPGSGDVRGGSITIGGAGFGNDTIVTVDGAAVTPVSFTPARVTLMMPPHAAGIVPVVVTTGGIATTLTYTYGIVNAMPSAHATVAAVNGVTPRPMPLPKASVSAPPGAATPLPAPARH